MDVDKIVSFRPQLDARKLVQINCPQSSQSISRLLPQRMSEKRERLEVEVTTPSAHPAMLDVREGLEVYEKKLRSRAQNFFDAEGPSWSKKHAQKRVAWSTGEQSEVRQLVEYVRGFVAAYSAALLDDDSIMMALKAHVEQTQQEFKGIYQACVNDILRHDPGYYKVLGVAHELKKVTPSNGFKALTFNAFDDYVKLFTGAVLAQERLNVYVTKLSTETGSIQHGGNVKHIFRMVEKEAFELERGQAGAAPVPGDAARAHVRYDSMEAMAKVLEQLKEDHDEGRIRVIRVKERFSEPTEGGWSDILVNLTCPSEFDFPCEIQIVHSQMMLIRQEMGAHKAYSKFRTAVEVLALHNARRRRIVSLVDVAEASSAGIEDGEVLMMKGGLGEEVGEEAHGIGIGAVKIIGLDEQEAGFLATEGGEMSSYQCPKTTSTRTSTATSDTEAAALTDTLPDVVSI